MSGDFMALYGRFERLTGQPPCIQKLQTRRTCFGCLLQELHRCLSPTVKGLEHTVEFRIAETDGIEFRCTLYYIGFGGFGV